MILKYGEVWGQWDRADLFLVPGSASLLNGHATTFGEFDRAARRFGLDFMRAITKAIKSKGVKFSMGDRAICESYYLLVSERWPDAKFGLFQTRELSSAKDNEILVSFSCDELIEWIPRGRGILHKDPVIVLAAPPSINETIHSLKRLPDCVEIWKPGSSMPLNIPESDPLHALIKCDEINYRETLLGILGIDEYTADGFCRELGFSLGSGFDHSPQKRLFPYFLLKAYTESLKENHAWHAAKNMMAKFISDYS